MVDVESTQEPAVVDAVLVDQIVNALEKLNSPNTIKRAKTDLIEAQSASSYASALLQIAKNENLASSGKFKTSIALAAAKEFEITVQNNWNESKLGQIHLTDDDRRMVRDNIMHAIHY